MKLAIDYQKKKKKSDWIILPMEDEEDSWKNQDFIKKISSQPGVSESLEIVSINVSEISYIYIN